MKVHNFSAGPSILPEQVMKKASEAVLDFNGIGLSILEISHRSKEFVSVIEEARSLVLELLGLDNKGYKVLFLQGGASMEFLRVPYNLMKVLGKASYLDTGTWAAGAIKQAQYFGEVKIAASSKDANYSYIPKNFQIDSDSDYFHCTSNNTIYGTQMRHFPDVEVPMVCDMSSDIFSRELDFSQFSLIYAGAQKNLGPAGVAVIIVKEDILGKTGRQIPSMMDYKVHIEKESMYNTPAVFAVYTSLLTLRWLKEKGGIAAMEKINNQKAELLYNEIDRNSLFEGTTRKEDRSKMNVTFVLKDESMKERFDTLWKNSGISGLSGHRSVGGYRASIYNAMPIESIQVLVEVMRQFEKSA